MSESFYHPRSLRFWTECLAGLPTAYREISLELLHILDDYGGTPSVRSQHQARGMYALLGKTPVLDHSINVALLCAKKEPGIITDLAVIAGLGHDFGKLEIVHRGHYVAAMHAYWGAQHVAGLIGGRLNEKQAEAVVHAIRDHHVPGEGRVHRTLREADTRSREQEVFSVVSTGWQLPSR